MSCMETKNLNVQGLTQQVSKDVKEVVTGLGITINDNPWLTATTLNKQIAQSGR